MKYSVIIPTLNAEKEIPALIKALQTQSNPPAEIIIIDSQSEDSTVSIAEKHTNVRVIQIRRDQFDHGGTRNLAIQACENPLFVMMTQDALPADSTCMQRLLKALEPEKVAAVTARQIPRADAWEYEKKIRAFRYPEKSRQWSPKDIPELGIRSFLLSDVCAAYKREAYQAVGGFENPIKTNEDMLIAADFLHAGYELAYCAEARVIHSHNHTFRQEYSRNKKIGWFLKTYSSRFGEQTEVKEGMNLVRQVQKSLLAEKKYSDLLRFYRNCAAKVLGSRVGRLTG